MYFFIGSKFSDRVPQNVKPTTTTAIFREWWKSYDNKLTANW